MDKRIFIAIPLEEDLQEKVIAWKEEFTRKTGMSFRWLDPKGLHITLVPPWQAKDREIESIKHILTQAIQPIMPFEIVFRKISYGPDPRNPRLVWAEGETPPDILLLKDRIEKTLIAARMPITVEKRPLKLHATLARFRPETFSSFKIKELNEEVHWYSMASSVAIMQSILQIGGAEYSVIERFFLR